MHLRGLPWEVSEEDIQQFFGDLVLGAGGIYICKNQSGQNTGDGFVQFADAENFARGLEKDKQNIGSRYIEVEKSTQALKEKAEFRSKPWNPHGRDGSSNGPVDANVHSISLNNNRLSRIPSSTIVCDRLKVFQKRLDHIHQKIIHIILVFCRQAQRTSFLRG